MAEEKKSPENMKEEPSYMMKEAPSYAKEPSYITKEALSYAKDLCDTSFEDGYFKLIKFALFEGREKRRFFKMIGGLFKMKADETTSPALPCDENSIKRFLELGAEKLLKIPEKGLFLGESKKFIQFLLDLNKEYDFPSLLEIQRAQECILLHLAKFIEPAKNVGGTPKVVQSLMEIFIDYKRLYDCNAILESVFLEKLFLVGMSKLFFIYDQEMRPYRKPEHPFWEKFIALPSAYSFLDIEHSFHDWQGREQGSDQDIIFKKAFIANVLCNYAKVDTPSLIEEKKFNQLAALYSNLINLYLAGRDNKSDEIVDKKLNFAIIEFSQTWFQGLNSIQDYLDSLKALKEVGEFSFKWQHIQSMQFNLRLFGKLLKTYDDYKKVIEAVLSFMEPAEPYFVVTQLQLFAKVNLSMTLYVVSEIKKSKNQEDYKKFWNVISLAFNIEQKIQYPPLLNGLLKLLPNTVPFFSLVENKLGNFISIASSMDSCRIQPEIKNFLGHLLIEAYRDFIALVYQDIDVSKLSMQSAEKKFVAGILINLMAIQKPTALEFFDVVTKFYKTEGLERQFITDLLIIRAQSLDSLEDLEEFLKLLMFIEQGYTLSEESIEKQLIKAVKAEVEICTNLSFSAQNPEKIDGQETQEKIKLIRDFKATTLFSQFTTFQEFNTLISGFSKVRNEYFLDNKPLDMCLIDQLFVLAESKADNISDLLELGNFSNNEAILERIFSKAYQTFFVAAHLPLSELQQLRKLPQSPLNKSFVSYVIHQHLATFKTHRPIFSQFEAFIKDAYTAGVVQNIDNAIHLDLLQGYFDSCLTSDDYKRFVIFITCESPCADGFLGDYQAQLSYENKANSFLKQVTKKLTWAQYQEFDKELTVSLEKRTFPEKIFYRGLIPVSVRRMNAHKEFLLLTLPVVLENLKSAEEAVGFIKYVEEIISVNQEKQEFDNILLNAKDRQNLLVLFQVYEKIKSDCEKALLKFEGEITALCDLNNQLWREQEKLFGTTAVDALKIAGGVETTLLKSKGNLEKAFKNLEQLVSDKQKQLDQKRDEFEKNKQAIDACFSDKTLAISILESKINVLSETKSYMTFSADEIQASPVKMVLSAEIAEIAEFLKREMGIKEKKEEALTRIQTTVTALPALTHQFLPTIDLALKTAQQVLKDKETQRVFADFALWLFDNRVFSGLPFIASLKQFSAEQKSLVVYAERLTELKGQAHYLEEPAEIQAENLESINQILVADMQYLQETAKDFIDQISEVVLKDEVQKTDWKASTKALITGTSELISSVQTIKSAQNTLLSQNATIPIKERFTELDKVKKELVALKAAEEKFGGKVAKQRYQVQLAQYRLMAQENKAIPFLQILNHAEMLFSVKEAYLADLIKGGSTEKVPAYPVDQLDPQGKTLLHLAIEQGSLEMVKFLVEKQKANVNIPFKSESSLFLAFKANHPEIVNYLREKGAESTGLNLSPLLMDRISEGNLDAVKFLFGENASHFKVDESSLLTGETLLYKAVVWAVNHQDSGTALVELLLAQESIKMNFVNNVGNQEKPLQLAVGAKNLSLVKLLLAAGKNLANYPHHTKDELLHLAIKAGDAPFVERLLDEGGLIKATFDPQDKDTDGNNPLHLAIKSGHEAVIQVLLKRTKWWTKNVPLAVFNEVNNTGESALHVAVKNGQSVIVEDLLAAGVNVNALNQFGSTVLQVAFTEGYLPIVERLLATKINANVANNFGNTVLHSMAKQGYLDLVKALIHREKSSFFTARALPNLINMQNAKGETALHLAMESFDLKLIELLIENGADAKVCNNEGKTPFETEKGELVFERIRDKKGKGGNRLFETLYQKLRGERIEEKHDQNQDRKEKSRDVNVPSSHLSADLFVYYRGSSENKWIVKGIVALKNAAPLISMRDTIGDTILHNVAAKNDLKMAEFIKEQMQENGQDWLALLNAKNDQGNTPLHESVRQKRVDLVKFLLNEGADKAIENQQEQTPWSMALEAKNPQLMGLLHDQAILSALIPTLDFMNDESSRVLWMEVLQNTPHKQKVALLNAQDKQGNTLLHAAVQHSVRGDADYLIGCHADTSIKNAEGKSPFTLAKMRRDERANSLGATVNEIKNDIFSLIKKNHIPEAYVENEIYDRVGDYHSQAQSANQSVVLFKNMGFALTQLLNRYVKITYQANEEFPAQKTFIKLITKILNQGNDAIKAHEKGQKVLDRKSIENLIQKRAAAIKDMKEKIAELESQAALAPVLAMIPKTAVCNEKSPAAQIIQTKARDDSEDLVTESKTNDFKVLRAQAIARRAAQRLEKDASIAGGVREPVAQPQPEIQPIIQSPVEIALQQYKELSELAKITNNMGVTMDDTRNTLLHLAISTGDVEVVKGVTVRAQLFECKNSASFTPLDLAVHQGHFEIVRLLVLEGAQAHQENFCSPSAKALVQHLADREMARQKIVLRKALSELQKQERQGDSQMIHMLAQRLPESFIATNWLVLGLYGLSDSAWVDSDALYQSPKKSRTKRVTQAVEKGKQLVKKAATTPRNLIEVYQHEKDIFDSESNAEQEKSTRGVNAVMKMNTWIKNNPTVLDPINAVDEKGNTLLHLAANDNMDVVVGWLLPKGVMDQLKDRLNSATKTIKGTASNIGQFVTSQFNGAALSEVADRLGQKAAIAKVGATVVAETAEFLGPFSVPLGFLAGKAASKAMGMGIGKVNGALTKKMLSLMEDSDEEDDIDSLPPCPSRGIDVNRQNQEGDTPLHVAVKDKTKILTVLAFLSAGANIHQQNKIGETPLHVAVKMGNVDAVEILVNIAQQKIDTQNAAGETPLHIAVQKGDLVLVKLLLDHKADSQIQTKLHQTPADLVEIKLALIKDSGEMLDKQKKAYLAIQAIVQEKGAENSEEISYYPSSFWSQSSSCSMSSTSSTSTMGAVPVATNSG